MTGTPATGTPAARAPARVWIEGRPAAALRRPHEREWRARVAAAGLPPTRGVRLDFVLAPGRWVDLDSVVEVAVAGLRDGGALGPRFATLDALVATKCEGTPTGVTATAAETGELLALPAPGAAAVDVAVPALPRPGDRDAKRALRARLAEAWQGRALLEGAVWAEVGIAATGSLLPALEPALDTLEPVLGRDPRGQPRQEFFPNDDRIVWLRVLRATPTGPALRLRLGPHPSTASWPAPAAPSTGPMAP